MGAESFRQKIQRLIEEGNVDLLYLYFVPGSEKYKEGLEPTATFASEQQRVEVSLAYPLLQRLIEEEAEFTYV